MSDRKLSHRARDMEAFIESNMLDSHGQVYTFVDRTTGKPLENRVLEAVDPIRLKKGTTAGWWKYENNSMNTGNYLVALLHRYEKEGDTQALFRARNCFEALKYIYDQGKRLEEGFMPKLYDDQFTEETSTDQVLYAMSALDHFHRHCTKAEQKECSRMIANMTRFFVNRDYKFPYFGIQNFAWPLPRFTFNLLMAYRHSGEEVFKKEYDRLLELGVNEHPGEEQMRLKLAGKVKPTQVEEEEGGWLFYGPINCAQMDHMELDYLIGADPTSNWVNKWRRSAIKMWMEAAPAISEDGWSFSAVVVDFETGEWRIPKSRYLPKEKRNIEAVNTDAPDTDDWSFFPFMTYLYGSKCSYSTLFARGGISISRHFPNEATIRPLARRIIKSFDLLDLTYFKDPDEFDAKFKYMTNVLSGDSITSWLWAYWQGRNLKVFGDEE